MRIFTFLMLITSICLSFSCANQLAKKASEPEPCQLDKINFDLESIDDRGLTGPPDGLRSVDYEFCIPNRNHLKQQVLEIYPTIRFYDGSAGRVGCTKNETLCIGTTDEHFRTTLCEFSKLTFVSKIEQTFWE